MLTFFVVLVLALVLVAFAGQWMSGRSRSTVVVRRRAPEVVEEVVDEPAYEQVPVTRRVVRRTRTY